MEKISGRICDNCRTLFYPNDHIVELCEQCANTVWCVVNLYEDDSRELSSIHHTEEGAKKWVEKNKSIIEKYNKINSNKIIKQDISQWAIL